MGPVCVYDVPVIEMIAKPALPDKTGSVIQPGSDVQCTADWINANTGVDLTAPCNVVQTITSNQNWKTRNKAKRKLSLRQKRS